MEEITNLAPEMSNLKCTLFSGSNKNLKCPVDFHDRCFSYWKTFWRGVFKDNGVTGDVLHEDDFFRQDVIIALTNDDEIAAMHLYTLFDLDLKSATAHDYFKRNYDTDYARSVRADGARLAMSMETMTVDSNWRKPRTGGISLGLILTGIGCEVQKALCVDASLGPCRMDVGVHKMLLDHGGKSYGQTNLYNTPVEFIAIHTRDCKPSADQRANQVIKNCWQNRTDFTDLTNTASNFKKAA